MEHVIFHLLFLCTMCMTMSYSSDVLQNPDFEIPPANITTNSSTSQFLLLTKENHIPGWSFNGTVYYVTSGGNFSYQGNGKAVQLGENGKINQTIRGIGSGEAMDYVLTFTLTGVNESCDGAAVNVTLEDRVITYSKSIVFLLQRNLSRNLGQNNALFLGRLGKGDSINLEVKSVGANSSCWPIVDSFNVKINYLPRWYDGNLLANGGFEIGPAFPKNSSDGILLFQDPDGPPDYSPLQAWAIVGTVKYIHSKNYKIPKGNAAIQLLSGSTSPSSGVQVIIFLELGSTYTLNFTMGDANDSCIGDFIVYLQIGRDIQNFTMRSNGTGSTLRRSVRFKREESISTTESTPMIFYSLNETRRSDGSICGPILDSIVLVSSRSSNGDRMQFHAGLMSFSLFLAYVAVHHLLH